MTCLWVSFIPKKKTKHNTTTIFFFSMNKCKTTWDMKQTVDHYKSKRKSREHELLLRNDEAIFSRTIRQSRDMFFFRLETLFPITSRIYHNNPKTTPKLPSANAHKFDKTQSNAKLHAITWIRCAFIVIYDSRPIKWAMHVYCQFPAYPIPNIEIVDYHFNVFRNINDVPLCLKYSLMNVFSLNGLIVGH